ncbi:hypothetical protein [Cohnella fermenti]|uniref:DUF5668 domain-containing protein n=1 Tax=Cohnella fermenti TaxID=2565925 RepID=A0A4S4BLI2_9BACL|nr:hypothetical protein [Cohnella fermenti]THF75620.1 hypothetical protein E6C55_21425 [Cohnella fermenti]
MNKQSAAVGVLALAAGLVILLGKLGVFAFIGSVFWPLLVLIPGILLHVLYFGRMLPAITLIPAGILTVIAVLLAIGNWFGWHSMKALWPFFILSVGVGLYEYDVFGPKRSKSLGTIAIALIVVSVLLFLLTLLWSWGAYLLAVILIAAGGWMVWKRPRFR